jgi:hypothetical protein
MCITLSNKPVTQAQAQAEKLAHPAKQHGYDLHPGVRLMGLERW